MDTPQLEFALLDAKELPVIACLSFGEYGSARPRSRDNMRVIAEATKEYLEGLLALQQAIRDKHEPRLTPETDDNILAGESLWRAESEVSKEVGDGLQLYYT